VNRARSDRDVDAVGSQPAPGVLQRLNELDRPLSDGADDHDLVLADHDQGSYPLGLREQQGPAETNCCTLVL
jgi:hypothetical protein